MVAVTGRRVFTVTVLIPVTLRGTQSMRRVTDLFILICTKVRAACGIDQRHPIEQHGTVCQLRWYGSRTGTIS